MGFAIRTLKTGIPIPLLVIDVKEEKPLFKIKEIVQDYEIQNIIVGYPIGMNNQENRMTKLVDQFIEDLSTFKLNITKIDERFSSDIFNNTKKERIDDLSALEILESYLKQNG